ncbi:DUF3524 domain-containing protein [Marinobacteraceae bacterium S3BR75-40.1]
MSTDPAVTGAAKRPRILCLSAYDADSHKRWRQTLAAMVPDVEWAFLTLPPRYFRWRIRGNPLSWFGHPLLQEQWDALVVTSMVDLATLRGLNRHLAHTPALAYFHENQFAYPVRDERVQSIDPQMVNLYTALSADRVVFNSDWNRQSFLRGVERLMKRLPDGVPERLDEALSENASILPVPIEDHWYHTRPPALGKPLHLVWNHRWEFDKGPDRLLRILQELHARDIDFKLSLVGQQFRQIPKPFHRIRQQFPSRIAHWGFLEDKARYQTLMQEADIVLSTALHDFQGLSVLEAMASGCLPVVPDRLAYPEYVPASCRYPSHEEAPVREARAAAELIIRWVANGMPDMASTAPAGFRQSELTPRYRQLVEALLEAPAA